MKTKEELNALKQEVETLNKKLAELTDEELALVSGDLNPDPQRWDRGPPWVARPCDPRRSQTEHQ